MSPRPNRLREPGRLSTETLAGLTLIGTVFAAVGTMWVASRLGRRLAGLPPRDTDPLATALDVATGRTTWPWQST
ncbi:MAG: hypothetical protein HGA44_22800, partial [Cellulomonadaceae bacterium]|nr:hypothetical protein [Cellulomonadaceae bacterium]